MTEITLPLAPDAEGLKRLTEALALTLWKLRHHLEGNLVVRITAKDIEAFKQSLDYNEQRDPVVCIDNRNGDMLVHVTDAKGDQIQITENNEEDLERGQRAKRNQYLRQQLPGWVQQVRSNNASQNFDLGLIEEVCQVAEALAREAT